MAEFYVESADFLIKIPPAIAEVAVLLEPLSIIEKGLKQASRYSGTLENLASENRRRSRNRKRRTC